MKPYSMIPQVARMYVDLGDILDTVRSLPATPVVAALIEAESRLGDALGLMLAPHPTTHCPVKAVESIDTAKAA